MPRGGARPNSGPLPSWNTGKTRTIRVPIALAEQLLVIARNLDVSGDKHQIPSKLDVTGNVSSEVEQETDSEDEEDELDEPDQSDGQTIRDQAAKNFKLLTENQMLERELREIRAGQREAIAILTPALDLKANAGGKIKDAIREVLKVLTS